MMEKNFGGGGVWEEKIACTNLFRSPFKITKFDFLLEYSSKSAKDSFPSEYFKIQNFKISMDYSPEMPLEIRRNFRKCLKFPVECGSFENSIGKMVK